jgi:hypothetical protein
MEQEWHACVGVEGNEHLGGQDDDVIAVPPPLGLEVAAELLGAHIQPAQPLNHPEPRLCAMGQQPSTQQLISYV